MAYVPVPKDLSKVKTKVALNLTKRQLICFSLAGILGIPIYLVSKSFIGNDIAAILMVMIMLPFFFIAMYEKDGFPAEKILYHIIRQKVLNQGIRPYKTDNFYTKIEKQIQLEKEVALLERKAKRASKQVESKVTSIKKANKKRNNAQKVTGLNKRRTKAS